MTMAMSAAPPRTPHSVPARAPDPAKEEFQLFREIKQRVQFKFQSLIIRALEISGILDCYESFDLSLQVRNKKIQAWKLSESPPVLRTDDA